MPAPFHSSGGILAFNVQLATGTNETADHNLANVTIPANQANVLSNFGDAYLFEALGTSDSAASATLNFWLKIGSTKAQTMAIATGTGTGTANPWWVRFMFVMRTTGTSGTCMIQGYGWHNKPNALQTANLIASPTATTINTTVSNSIILGMNWGAASTSNNCRADITWVEKIAGAGQ